MSLTARPAVPFPAWLRLSLEPGLGPAAARALLAQVGDAAAVFACPPHVLEPVVGVGLARRLAAPPTAEIADAVAQAMAWAGQPGHWLITQRCETYPPALRHTHDPPPILYALGEPERLRSDAIAIVGARNATPGGLASAQGFARRLAEAGWCVASGLAAGIDAAAHEGALLAGPDGGGTVAVLGTGIDVVYPARNRGLAQRLLAGGGVMVSELPLGAPPRAAHFPRRNRLVAGMSRGVIVVEAAVHSGSLITARLAADMGREVFAIPGSIHSPLARGCHALIRQGAKLTETVDDVLEEVGRLAERPVSDPAPGTASDADAAVSGHVMSDEGRQVLAALGYDPVFQDDLQRRLGWAAGALQAALLRLELAGAVVRLPGGRFERRT